MPLTYALLGVAICAEVTGTLALRSSHGFTRLAPSAAVITCYVVAFVALSYVLERGMQVAVAYALWSAIGIFAIALIGVLFLHERLNVAQYVGMLTVIVGVVTVLLGTSTPTT
ncbi:MAG: QacE family quaternary ammonium compound efflux transporter [Marmoricola sp.]|nr:QacE family quaternary ammonium compound efflux transporter [Marmoricola sp.]